LRPAGVLAVACVCVRSVVAAACAWRGSACCSEGRQAHRSDGRRSVAARARALRLGQRARQRAGGARRRRHGGQQTEQHERSSAAPLHAATLPHPAQQRGHRFGTRAATALRGDAGAALMPAARVRLR
jgi:hypothetical protein